MEKIHNKEILVSIVVPIYRVEKYLDKCISSIIRQTYTNLEIILVDDGSPDLCPQICDKYLMRDNRIKVIHQENKGLVSARKSGIKYATGEYLVYVDGDDWIDDEYIANYVNELEDEFPDILWSLASYREYDGDASLCGFINISKKDLNKKTVQDELYRKVIGKYGFQNAISYTLCMKCFKLSFLKNIQYSINDAISYDEDFCCMIRCLANNPKVLFIRNDGYYYVQRGDSINHEQSDRDKNLIMMKDTLQYLNRMTGNTEILENIVRKQYMISQIYHGGVAKIQDNNKDDIVPFINAKKHKKIILYGMGTTGKSLLQYFEKTKIVDVIGYMDVRKQDRIINIPFVDISDLNKLSYDYILVSVVKEYFAKEIQQNLYNMGIPRDKVALIDMRL